jgi:hypothetical protein
VSIKGDSSIFSSTGHVNGNTVSASGYGTPTVSAGAGRPNASYNSQHLFDAPASSSYAPSYNTGQSSNSDRSSAYNALSYNIGQPTGSFGSSSYTLPSQSNTPQNRGYNTGQSTADNFLSSGGSVKRSRSMDPDDDDDMLGYDSPHRRGDSFLSEPDPQFVGQPIHYGKWMSELYLEQGVDLLSGGMEGFGAIMGEMQRGGSGGGAASGAGAAGASSPGPGYATSNDGYRSSAGSSYATNNDGYARSGYAVSNDGYGSSSSGNGSNSGYGNSNSGYSSGGYESGAGGGFRGAPPGGYWMQSEVN